MRLQDAGTQAVRREGAPSGQVIEVDAGLGLPVALDGLRQVLTALQAQAPAVVEARAAERPAAWNRIFPGTFRDVPDLADLALTPSERRLHRESEQMYWVLNLAAGVVVDVLRHTGGTLHVSGAGASDLVSLRALMRATEWGRLMGLEGRIQLSGWNQLPVRAAALFEERRRHSLQSLAERMRTPLVTGVGPVVPRPMAPSVDLEGRYLQATLDPERPPEHQVAAAILAIRCCFFSTNYEGAMLAAEHGLSVLDRAGADLSAARVAEAWDALDTGLTTPAIEIDRDSLGDSEELRALLHRCVGVVYAYAGDFDAALAAFARGLETRSSPERQAQLRMYRALTFIKRLGNLERARSEIEQGLSVLSGRESSFRYLHEGWLRNVYALTYFQDKKLEQALEQEKLAMRCVGDLHDPSATHLKINLISNVSVLQESARRYGDAITTWRRFESVSARWGENFSKHHRYRLGGLQLLAGERDEAVDNYEQAYASAERLGDTFHRQVIAAELGQLALVEGRTEAADWFQRAVDAAREVGDPLRFAQSLAGRELAGQGQDWSQALEAALADSTSAADVEKLVGALRSGSAEAVLAALPRPRSKLNRPFDCINLY